MTITTTAAGDEAQLRTLIDEWAAAIRAKDVDAVMRHYAHDVVVFDVMPPLFVRASMHTVATGKAGSTHSRGKPISNSPSCTLR